MFHTLTLFFEPGVGSGITGRPALYTDFRRQRKANQATLRREYGHENPDHVLAIMFLISSMGQIRFEFDIRLQAAVDSI